MSSQVKPDYSDYRDHSNNKLTGQPNELINVTYYITRVIQKEDKFNEISELKTLGEVSLKSNIFRLSPYLNKNNIIRVGGRLTHANHLDCFQKNFMIIPLNNLTTYLIFQNVYEALLHGGP